MSPHRTPGGGAGVSSLLLKLALGIALAGLFGYFFLRGSDFGKLRESLAGADPAMLGAAVAVGVTGFLVRAERWRCLLAPVRRVSFVASFEILMIGYTVANFAPRGTDLIVRAALLMRSERVAMATVLATCAVERLLDLLLLVLLFAGYLVFFPPASLGDVSVSTARLAGLGMLIVSLAAVAFLLLLRRHESACFRLLERLTGWMPTRLHLRLQGMARSFATGLDLFHNPRLAAMSFLWTMAGWVTVGASMWLVCVSLGLDMVRPLDSCLLMGLGVVGIAVPAPGGVGSFHYFILQGLRGLGVVDLDAGKAAAILMWALSVVPTTLFGLLALMHRGLGIGDLERSTADAEAEVAAVGTDSADGGRG